MITYNAINVNLPDINQEAISKWIEEVAFGYGKRVDTINYIFVDDEEILRIHRQFIGHDYYNDHIGFDTCQGNLLSGDTFISLDTVLTNSEKFSTPYDQELLRVVIHSVLHLCGIDDLTDEEAQEMRMAEDKALALLHNFF